MTVTSFNPHPAHRLGATLKFTKLTINPNVSILTQLTGWVLLSRASAWVQAEEVSILTQLTGWVLPERLKGSPRCRRVSILTQLTGWVLPDLTAISRYLDGFQSSPSSQAGCYGAVRECGANAVSFNPHPAHRLGATGVPIIVYRCLKVSILTQLTGWVLLGC